MRGARSLGDRVDPQRPRPWTSCLRLTVIWITSHIRYIDSDIFAGQSASFGPPVGQMWRHGLWTLTLKELKPKALMVRSLNGGPTLGSLVHLDFLRVMAYANRNWGNHHMGSLSDGTSRGVGEWIHRSPSGAVVRTTNSYRPFLSRTHRKKATTRAAAASNRPLTMRRQFGQVSALASQGTKHPTWKVCPHASEIRPRPPRGPSWQIEQGSPSICPM